MAIYKYTIKKYMSSWSTWIITAISFVITFLLGGYIPFKFGNTDNVQDYAVICVISVALISSFMSIFTSVFAGFKAATMFKDEVEDGTFLVMLSKPISRPRIILYKWLALQTVIAGYTLFVALSFLIAVVSFDTGSAIKRELASMGIKTITSQGFGVTMMLWVVLFIVSLIFSSVALLLSTKLTVGTTIGISIAIGVVIPVTSMIGTFTSKPPFEKVSNTNLAIMEPIVNDTINGLADKNLPSELGEIKDQIKKFTEKDMSFVESPKTLYGVGFATNEKDTFKFAQTFDLNYQIQKLSEFSSEQVTPEQVRNKMSFSEGVSNLRTVTTDVDETNPFELNVSAQKNLQKFNEMVVSSWDYMQTYRDLVAAIVLFMMEKGEIQGDITLPGEWITAISKTEPALVLGFNKINESNKAQVLQNIKDNVAPFLLKTREQLENELKALPDDASKNLMRIKFARAETGMWGFVHGLAGLKNWVSLDKYNLPEDIKVASSRIINYLPGYAYYSFSTMDIWFKRSSLTTFISDHGITKRNILTKSESHNKVKELGILEELIRQNEFDMEDYNLAYSVISAGYDMARVKTVEYTSKFTVLWIYLAIALVLVPTSYMLIRKQDVR